MLDVSPMHKVKRVAHNKLNKTRPNFTQMVNLQIFYYSKMFPIRDPVQNTCTGLIMSFENVYKF